jgi:hydroxyethylthiazole kinase-like uncharacterized protein yjeF
MLKRNKNSHKGENGRVLVVGGNEVYHGAPLLAALAAEKSGVDLCYVMVPVNQQNLARQFSLNLIVDTFSGKFLRPQDVKKVIDWTKKVDVLVIGNGLGEKPQTLRSIKKILEQSKCDVVIDAAALSLVPQLEFHGRQAVITPHREEFSRLVKKDLNQLKPSELKKLLQEKAKEWHVVIVLKGAEDLLACPYGKFQVNKTGHPIMTKGGTGDVLAGLIAGLIAQGIPSFEASFQAVQEWGKVGESVAKKKGLMVTIEEMMEKIG